LNALLLAFISQSRNDIGTWFFHQTVGSRRITSFSQVIAYTRPQATLFAYPITVPLTENQHHLSTAHTFLLQIIDQRQNS